MRKTIFKSLFLFIVMAIAILFSQGVKAQSSIQWLVKPQI
jgi:hypothetical protein